MPSAVKSMAVLSLIGLVDAISYMAVAPSLIFYVLQVGGDKETYGLIMSAFSFASFCAKPVYGIWVDKAGNKFRTPYVFSFGLAIFGALLYLLANGSTSPKTAVAVIFVGRLFSGLGGANQALGFAYIASVIPQEQQTLTNSILSMTRVVGMALGPVVNLLLAEIDTSITIGGFHLPMDPLNSVGLLLAIANLFVATCLILFLEEPPEKEKLPDILKAMAGSETAQAPQNIWKAVSCIEVILPILTLLVVNSSFQLVETAFPPAAADGIGWGPVETSAVLGSTSIVIFFSMVMNIFLSGKLHDLVLVAIGNVMWIIGGLGMYLFWKRDASALHFALPIMIAVIGFPFIAASNRSTFTKAVASKAELEGSAALMQSILSMSASVAGFVTPGMVATFVIRTPEQVTASRDNRELTPVALYVPILPCFVLMGLYRSYLKEKREEAAAAAAAAIATTSVEEAVAGVATEQTSLLSPTTQRRRSSVVAIAQNLSIGSIVSKRLSGETMGGLTVFDTADEKKFNAQLEEDWHEWQELAKLDYNDDDDDGGGVEHGKR